MTDKVYSALGAAGVFRAIAPKEVGGDDLTSVEQVLVCEELGYADPSVAWCVLNSWGSGLYCAPRMDPDDRDRLYSQPDLLYGFGFAPGGRAQPVDGGYVLTGRWPVVSGCARATWFALNSIVWDGDGPAMVDGAPDVKFVLVPATAVNIEETWSDVVGLRGSGSHAVHVSGAHISAGMTVRFSDPLIIDRPSFRFPLLTVQNTVGGALLGAARSAVDSLIEQAAGRVSAASGQAWREWPNVQDTLATCMAAVRAAKAGLLEVSAAAELELAVERHLSASSRAALYTMIDHAHRTARQAVSQLYTAGSIDSLHHGHGLERALRDVHAMSVNWERFRQVHYDSARVLLGLEPVSRLF